eukprot:361389-Chlamydomonas_euryale.AAC.8
MRLRESRKPPSSAHASTASEPAMLAAATDGRPAPSAMDNAVLAMLCSTSVSNAEHRASSPARRPIMGYDTSVKSSGGSRRNGTKSNSTTAVK